MLLQFMKEKRHYVNFVNLILQKKTIWTSTFYQFMREKKSLNNLNRQIENIHEEKRISICNVYKNVDLCGKSALNDHLVMNMKLICSIWTKNFASRRNLRLHISSIHKMNEQFDCNMCNSKFSHKSNLKCRILALHNLLKRFRSQRCEKLSKWDVCCLAYVGKENWLYILQKFLMEKAFFWVWYLWHKIEKKIPSERFHFYSSQEQKIIQI